MFTRSPSTNPHLILCDHNVAMVFEHVHLIVQHLTSSLGDLLVLAK